MRTFDAEFLTAAPVASAFPAPTLPEIAVVGRSNSGKSTLINSLVGKRALARVSAKPGRTRAVNFFSVQQRFLLVDLPGYGYATGSRSEQAGWSGLVASYLGGDRPLEGVLALFDIRRRPDEMDGALVAMLERYELAWQAVWTKADKLKRSRLTVAGRALDRLLGPPTPGIVFSSRAHLGRDALLDWVERRVNPDPS